MSDCIEVFLVCGACLSHFLTHYCALLCVVQTLENEGRCYECGLLPFMELGSVAHKYYLLNIRLPIDERKKINVGIGEIKDIRLVVSFYSA